jgi:hypothetical protein
MSRVVLWVMSVVTLLALQERYVYLIGYKCQSSSIDVYISLQIFTDTGEYVLRMDAVDGNSRGMTLDERAVTLACAISIDFDYFSRHSSHG